MKNNEEDYYHDRLIFRFIFRGKWMTHFNRDYPLPTLPHPQEKIIIMIIIIQRLFFNAGKSSMRFSSVFHSISQFYFFIFSEKEKKEGWYGWEEEKRGSSGGKEEKRSEKKNFNTEAIREFVMHDLKKIIIFLLSNFAKRLLGLRKRGAGTGEREGGRK